ncbi:unnamed protein product [Staurois parvus]|uniref:Uncharacterized protein n=1 Tax=Staurois parvus TaxID=386267 RepID=A0ABN9HNV4_9NEOB|nr:unnamed protein product [Staurois parvus]
MTVPDYYEIIKQHREQVDGLMEEARAIGKDGWTPFDWLGSGFGSVFSWMKGIAVSIVMILFFVFYLYIYVLNAHYIALLELPSRKIQMKVIWLCKELRSCS